MSDAAGEAIQEDRLGVIFDMDGVLVDSYEPHFESWRNVARERGVEISPAQFATLFGRTSREIIAELWGGSRFTAAEMHDIDQHKEAEYRELVAARFPAMDGAAELIRDLAAGGFGVAIGSSGPPENVALAVASLQVEELVSVRVTGRDVQRGKPDPQVFLLAAERLGIPPARCAVIEDAPVGIQAANRAGMASIGLASTGHTVESLQAARRVVGSLRELSVQIVRRMIEDR